MSISSDVTIELHTRPPPYYLCKDQPFCPESPDPFPSFWWWGLGMRLPLFMTHTHTCIFKHATISLPTNDGICRHVRN